MPRVPLTATVAAALLLVGSHAPAPEASPNSAARGSADGLVWREVEFAILEDYDKNESLDSVARDFGAFRRLGITSWRGSWGWDDYEPRRGREDFAWLHRFATLARDSGITLRPYVGYTPAWAAIGRRADGQLWNDPPARASDFASFVGRLARAMRRHPNVASYEIYNEENVPLWWDGSREEYEAVLAAARAAIRRASPRTPVVMGGLVWADAQWVEDVCTARGGAARPDVVALHAYPETWTPESVRVENYFTAARAPFLRAVDRYCGRAPFWMNEVGFATTPGKSHEDQADWWARAIATWAADPRVSLIGVYEIRDAPRDKPVIGDAPNYYLGLQTRDRRPKLAFHTVRLLVSLLGHGEITAADSGSDVTVTSGAAGELHHHVFLRRDGRQVALVWDRRAAPVVSLTLPRAGTAVTEYGLDGGAATYRRYDGRTIGAVRLAPGRVRIFVVTPPPH
jgi:polysaccharide biosynthesis protein PslG